MGALLRVAGVGMIIAWLALFLVGDLLGLGELPWREYLLYGGLALAALSFLLSGSGRSGPSRSASKRCVRCSKKVAPGQIYCEEHAQQAFRSTQKEHKDNQHR